MTKSKGILIKDPIKRFWTFTQAYNSDDCWVWIGRKSYKGYGVMKINNHSVSAHRFSYELHRGKIPNGMLVCHHCDNPACVNPSHLFLGTIQDNNLDRDKKGRKALGEDNGKSKLTEYDVREIKKLISLNISDSEISRRFNCWHTTIRAIRINKTWSQIQ
jgi:HNH endonuclease